MIRQQVGDLLEIRYDGRYYYVVVLTTVAMFGGNLVFAYHTDGARHRADDLLTCEQGFNVCCDLLWPKREGLVTRLHRFGDVSGFWRSPYAKACHAYAPGQKARQWFIYRLDDLHGDPIARVTRLPRKYRAAMDRACFSFDLVAEKIRQRYTPDQNEHI